MESASMSSRSNLHLRWLWLLLPFLAFIAGYGLLSPFFFSLTRSPSSLKLPLSPSQSHRHRARFLEVPQIAWGLNNQKIALARALLTARFLNRSLLLPSLSASLTYKDTSHIDPLPFDHLFSLPQFNSLCEGFVAIAKPSAIFLQETLAFNVSKRSGRRWTKERDLQQLLECRQPQIDRHALIRVSGKNPFLWHDHWPVRDYARVFQCFVLVDNISAEVDRIFSKLKQRSVHLSTPEGMHLYAQKSSESNNYQSFLNGHGLERSNERIGNGHGFEKSIAHNANGLGVGKSSVLDGKGHSLEISTGHNGYGHGLQRASGYVAVHMRIEKDWMIHCKKTEERIRARQGKLFNICSSKQEIIDRVSLIPNLHRPSLIYLAVADVLLEDSTLLDGWEDGLIPFEKKKLGFLQLYKKYPYLIQSALDYEVCLRADIFVGNSFSTFSSLIVLERTLKMLRIQPSDTCGTTFPSFAYNLPDINGGPQRWITNLSDVSVQSISYGTNHISCDRTSLIMPS